MTPTTHYLSRVSHMPMNATVKAILSVVHGGRRNCYTVGTPNLDQLRQLDGHSGLRSAYDSANLLTPDGWPVKLLAGAPERVSGSDLVPALFRAADPRQKLRVFFMGGNEGVAQRAARVTNDTYIGVDSAGHDCPPFGFEDNPLECRRIIDKINETRPDILLVGVGCPKQEMWVAAHRDLLKVPVAMCVGATIGFIAGTEKRAPMWMRAIWLEWLHRLLSDPRRLTKRYAADAVYLIRLVWTLRVSKWRMQEGMG